MNYYEMDLGNTPENLECVIVFNLDQILVHVLIVKKRLRVWETHYLNVGHSDVGKSEEKPVLHHGRGKCLLNEG